MTNFAKYYIRNALFSVALMLVNGTIIQTFLSNAGVETGLIGLYITVTNIINVVITILFANSVDKLANKRTKKTISLLLSAFGVMFVGFIPFCFLSPSPAVVFGVFIIVGGIQAAFVALRTIFEYKLPYQIIDMKDYNKLMSVDGIVTGVVGMLPSLILSFLFKLFPYYNVMAGFFLLSVFLIFLSVMVNNSFKLISEEANENYKKDKEKSISADADKIAIIALLRKPEFNKLIIPNILRGILMGVIGMAAVIGLNESVFTVETTPYIAFVLSAANVLGSAFYVIFTRKIEAHKLCIMGSILTTAMPLMAVKSVPIFLVGYFIASLGVIMINYSVPYMVYRMIHPDMICVYNSWRMILTTAGNAIATTLVGYIISDVPIWMILALSVICQLISMVGYHVCYTKNK